MNTAYYKRNIDQQLQDWREETHRKTLLLRGARQVGKSTAIKNLGAQFTYFVELNFDQYPQLHTLFEQGLSPQDICSHLSLFFQTPIIPSETLLFFDEIQACIPALSSLRYFYEAYPELHVIAAGSLLEFALEETPSIGVGRTRSLFMYPFSFDEFLRALNQGNLVEAYRRASPSAPLMEPIHQKILEHFKIFLIIGGMPEVVAHYAATKNLLTSQRLLNDQLISLTDDFAKYKKRVPSLRIKDVFSSVVQQAEGKFVYKHASTEANHLQIREALKLLIMAGLVYPITHTNANGIPLGAEINPKYQRMILCDTGLFLRILDLNTATILLSNDFKTVNRGALAEIAAGLELLKASSCYDPPHLYCWAREKREGNAQVDYIIQRGEQILPIEIKSGTQGSMQSLRLFMEKKKLTQGIRTSLENFGRIENIDIYPLYAISNLIQAPEV